MNWQRYLVHDYFTARELDRVDSQMQSVRRLNSANARVRRALEQRTDELEDDLARAYLMIGALTEACVRKGVFTSDELGAIMHEIDLSDGTLDGKVTNPQPGAGDEGPKTTAQFLRDLERRDS